MIILYLYKYNIIFIFQSYPHTDFLESLNKLTKNQTTVQLDYAPSEIPNQSLSYLATHRLSVLFDVVDDDLKIKDFIMSRRRLFMDTLMMDRYEYFFNIILPRCILVN